MATKEGGREYIKKMGKRYQDDGGIQMPLAGLPGRSWAGTDNKNTQLAPASAGLGGETGMGEAGKERETQMVLGCEAVSEVQVVELISFICQRESAIQGAHALSVSADLNGECVPHAWEVLGSRV